jgi:hypothetical protein
MRGAILSLVCIDGREYELPPWGRVVVPVNPDTNLIQVWDENRGIPAKFLQTLAIGLRWCTGGGHLMRRNRAPLNQDRSTAYPLPSQDSVWINRMAGMLLLLFPILICGGQPGLSIWGGSS